MPKIVQKVKLKCVHCNIEYEKQPSKAVGSRFCSRLCANRGLANEQKVDRVNSECDHCGKEYIKLETATQKYCSRECVFESAKIERVELVCSCCNIKFERPINRQTKHCSKHCQFVSQSSGMIEIPSSGRMGFRKDLPPNYFFKSSLEADYARYCDAIKKPYIYEHKTFDVNINGTIKVYTPDFYHPDEDKYVETKAIRKDAKFSGNLHAAEILQQQGLNLDIMYMDDFYKMLKIKGLYYGIDNIENKNYLGTKHLIYQRTNSPTKNKTKSAK